MCTKVELRGIRMAYKVVGWYQDRLAGPLGHTVGTLRVLTSRELL
jgi:hypothetical protein